MTCHNCGEEGHLNKDCPLRFQAASYREHLGRIDRLVDLWVTGRISKEQKRRMISAGNVSWYGPDNPVLRSRGLTYP
jgi:hypothetical protein